MGEDTEMKSPSPTSAEGHKPDDTPVKSEPGADGDGPKRLTKEDLSIMKGVTEHLAEYKDTDGYETAGLFQRMLNKRLIPDYFEVIKEPTAFSTIRGKILKRTYTSWSEWVRDFALISHNAQVYNRPSALVYRDAIALRELFKLELAKLVDKNILTAEEAELPDLGEIPPVEDSPPPNPDDEEVDDDDDDDDEDEDEEDSDDDRPRRGRAGRKGRPSTLKHEGSKLDDSKDDADARKVRGRPPKVHTPMEARINTLLKGMRKFKNPGGDLKILPFERLPDKSVMPEYYQEIKNPIAMDLIKRKAKRKKYQSVDSALRDLELMFDNAKEYNLEDSQVYRDAVDLQKEARIIAEQEKKKPDSDFADEDGRLPLSEILHNGELWKVGDWVHLQNPNDLTKPIVAQIYRTWQDSQGLKWINACWYYRPEQTVHQYEKHFFENEVVKTGQYRDHQVDEIVDRCFVMFFTRYNKGRPRGFPVDKEVYVCEARYNEQNFKLNKIKTWASCVPDEVRERDYEMDLFDVPRKMKKVPSPIKHLLREDAKEDDPLPKPTWGAANAPPIVGAVHKHPREAADSPPPSPTPEPSPLPQSEPIRPAMTSRPSGYGSSAEVPISQTASSHAPTASTSQQAPPNSYGQQFSRPSASPAPTLAHQNSYGSHTSTHTPLPQTPGFASHHSTSFNPQYPVSTPSAMAHNSTPNPLTYTHSHTVPQSSSHYAQVPLPTPSHTTQAQNATSHRPAMPHSSSSTSTATNAYNPPRPVEVYHLSDSANASIPMDIRAQFHRDQYDRVLFFTAPPLDVPSVPAAKKTLGHSVKYLAKKLRDTAAAAEAAKKKRADSAALAANANSSSEVLKRKQSEEDEEDDLQALKRRALQVFSEQIETGTAGLYKRMFGEEWESVKKAEAEQLKLVQEEQRAKREGIETREALRWAERQVKLS